MPVARKPPEGEPPDPAAEPAGLDIDKIVEGLKGHAAFADLFAGPAPATPKAATSSRAEPKGDGGSITDQIELALRRREEQTALARGVAKGVQPPTEPEAPKSWRDKLWNR